MKERILHTFLDASQQAVMANLQREAIEEWERDCMHGKRRKAAPAKHIMSLYQNLEPGCRYEFSATHRSILVDS